jgi:hypothetical protein
METLVVMVIVGFAAGYLIKKYAGSLKKSSQEADCGCGCTSCPSPSDCDTDHKMSNHESLD